MNKDVVYEILYIKRWIAILPTMVIDSFYRVNIFDLSDKLKANKQWEHIKNFDRYYRKEQNYTDDQIKCEYLNVNLEELESLEMCLSILLKHNLIYSFGSHYEINIDAPSVLETYSLDLPREIVSEIDLLSDIENCHPILRNLVQLSNTNDDYLTKSEFVSGLDQQNEVLFEHAMELMSLLLGKNKKQFYHSNRINLNSLRTDEKFPGVFYLVQSYEEGLR